jgi:hypothetical protein
MASSDGICRGVCRSNTETPGRARSHAGPACKKSDGIYSGVLFMCLLVMPFQIVEAPRDGLPRPGVSRIRDKIYISEPWGEKASLDGVTIGIDFEPSGK